jgi:very-short-patch-repair endonuclease
MATVSANELNRIPLPAPSRVRLVFAPTLNDVHISLKNQAISSGGNIRLVSVTYDRLPTVKSLIDDTLEHLAHVALSLFPNWYGDRSSFAEIDASTSAFDFLLSDYANQSDLLERGVSIPWLKAARKLCHSGKSPLPREFTASVHIAQLALVIDLSPLLIALILQDEKPSGEGLQGLARTSEWLSRETRARVIVVVPESLSSSTELDSINFDAVHLSTGQHPSEPAPNNRQSRVSVFPVIGQPRPFSRGEQLLAKRLARDEMLAGLFQFNIRVTAENDNHYLVDLVWSEGKVIVEVDGYEFHSDRGAFSQDRRRDYELMISGYLVLRLPHDEVVEDVELAVDKIRDMVRFRRASGLPRSENKQ